MSAVVRQENKFGAFAVGSAQTAMDNGLIQRLNQAMFPFGAIPTDRRTALNAKQMRAGKAILQSELREHQRMISHVNVEEAMSRHREHLVDILERTYAPCDAYCLVHGDYPLGYLGSAAMGIYHTIKVVDGIVVYMADRAYQAALGLAGKVLPALPPPHRVPQPVLPGSTRGVSAVQRISPQPSPRDGTAAVVASIQSQTLQASVDEKGNGNARRGSTASESGARARGPTLASAHNRGPSGNQNGAGTQIVRRKTHARSNSMVAIGEREDGSRRAGSADERAKPVRVLTRCTQIKNRIQNSYIYQAAKWTWDYVLPEEIKDDIENHVRNIYRQPVRTFVWWVGRGVALLVVTNVAARVGLIGGQNPAALAAAQ